jgi:hypothetical protein
MQVMIRSLQPATCNSLRPGLKPDQVVTVVSQAWQGERGRERAGGKEMMDFQPVLATLPPA